LLAGADHALMRGGAVSGGGVVEAAAIVGDWAPNSRSRRFRRAHSARCRSGSCWGVAQRGARCGSRAYTHPASKRANSLVLSHGLSSKQDHRLGGLAGQRRVTMLTSRRRPSSPATVWGWERAELDEHAEDVFAEPAFGDLAVGDGVDAHAEPFGVLAGPGEPMKVLVWVPLLVKRTTTCCRRVTISLMSRRHARKRRQLHQSRPTIVGAPPVRGSARASVAAASRLIFGLGSGRRVGADSGP
jgi:hypothetical protein